MSTKRVIAYRVETNVNNGASQPIDIQSIVTTYNVQLALLKLLCSLYACGYFPAFFIPITPGSVVSIYLPVLFASV